VVLFAGVFTITAGCAFQFGLPYLVPSLRAHGLSLAQAATLVACPSVGLLLTLVVWGVAADRWGERAVLTLGMALAVPALIGAAMASRTPSASLLLGVCLVAAGAAGACVHAASGRLILGWFGAHERGLAMGIRQTAQPLGVGLSALTLPVLGGRDPSPAFFALAGFSLLAVLVVVLAVRDPATSSADRPQAGRSPYRDARLWRLHASSALLVVPQFTVAAFGLTYLVDHLGWQPADGGRLLAVAALAGATARLVAGWWSDRVGSRVGPLRLVAVAICVAMATLTVGAAVTSGTGTARVGTPATVVAVAALLIAGVITVSPNGLAFTAVAEYAGRALAGRALGIQNTGQNAVAALTPPLIASVVAAHGYTVAFALAVLPPVLASVLVPPDRAVSAAPNDPAPADPAPADPAGSAGRARGGATGTADAGRSTG
jgi:nitrate/nitrite transporter NarK